MTEKIKDFNVTTEKINNDAVTTKKIADSCVTTEKINNLAITTDKIADGNVTESKLSQDIINKLSNIESDISKIKHYIFNLTSRIKDLE